MLTVLLFGAGPAFAAARRDFNDRFGRAAARTPREAAAACATTLVVAEITLTVVLLAAAGLLLRSYAAVLAVDPGFEPDNLLIADTPLSPSRMPTRRARRLLPPRARARRSVAGRRERRAM